MNKSTEHIIVALATPYGKSAIAVIRVSGSGCIELCEKFLKSRISIDKLKVNSFKTETFSEQLMVVGYKAPHSYTGEDTVELFPHGNMTICDGIVKTLINAGARCAERGEFTKRAFLNGKLDLMQCEALADIIDAQTPEQLAYGYKRYNLQFKALENAEKTLNGALSTIEAIIHYGDELEHEDIDKGIAHDVYDAIDTVIDELDGEIRNYAGGKAINDGLNVALIGAPNVGKSTLLNALVQRDRAIVTPIAGTTRDTVEDSYIYNGKKFNVIDTAGITDTDDIVEKLGVERAISAASTADVIIYVSDGGKTECNETFGSGATTVKVRNKCDDETDVGTEYIKARQGDEVFISAKQGINITALKQLLYDICPKESGGICNHRQYDCVVRCRDACLAAKSESKNADGLELVAAELYDAYSAIQELYGAQADEKILDSLFERFCVGK